MEVKQLKIGALGNFVYVCWDTETGEGFIVDSCEPEKIARETAGLKIRYIFLTHGHFDHTYGCEKLSEILGAKIVAHSGNRSFHHMDVEDGAELMAGKIKIKVLHTPGHTADSICILADKKLFTGDTLFVGECGRTDLPGGSSEALYHSLFQKILLLEDVVEVYPGHDYGPRPWSTIGHERRHNYTLKPRTLEEFVQFMRE
ncbi:MAG: MBL fold metallo-hydrolase [Thermoplasmata archaeon]|nr:MBL fold metallo-hydrolase [Thermoplasmata archaeon]